MLLFSVAQTALWQVLRVL